MNALQRLQDWYSAQCNGDWEHQQGVRIESLDNPGWALDIDLADTALADKFHGGQARLRRHDRLAHLLSSRWQIHGKMSFAEASGNDRGVFDVGGRILDHVDRVATPVI